MLVFTAELNEPLMHQEFEAKNKVSFLEGGSLWNSVNQTLDEHSSYGRKICAVLISG